MVKIKLRVKIFIRRVKIYIKKVIKEAKIIYNLLWSCLKIIVSISLTQVKAKSELSMVNMYKTIMMMISNITMQEIMINNTRKIKGLGIKIMESSIYQSNNNRNKDNNNWVIFKKVNNKIYKIMLTKSKINRKLTNNIKYNQNNNRNDNENRYKNLRMIESSNFI